METLLGLGGDKMFLEVYDLSYKRLAVLKDAYDLEIVHEENTWPVLSFSLPINSDNWQYIKNEFYIKYLGGYYVIKREDLKLGNSGEATYQVECPSIACELNDKLLEILGSRVGPPDFSPEIFHESGTPEYLMELILEDTGWSVGTISDSLATKVRSLMSEFETVPANLLSLAEAYEAFLIYRPNEKEVDLLDESDLGQDNGVTIEYRKNMTEMSRSTNTDQLVTKLAIYGGVPPYLGESDQLEMTVNEVGLGVDDPQDPYYRPPLERIYDGEDWVSCTHYIYNFQYFIGLGYSIEDITADIQANGKASKFVREGHLKEDDYIDPYKLYDRGKKLLDTEYSKPEVSYDIGLLNLAKLAGLGYEHESFSLGDTITVVNTDWGLEIKGRIVKYTEYPEFPEKDKVEISNIQDTIGDVLARTVDTSNKLRKKSVTHQLLRNAISTATTIINSSYGLVSWKNGQLTLTDVETDGSNNIILDENEEPIKTGKLVRLSPGGLGVSDDAGQTFPYAITGEGILGDKLIVSDAHIVSVEDGFTRLRSHGLEVYDRLGTKRVHVGQFDDDEFGIVVHSGSIKITGGGLPDSEIGSISAGKIIGGIITAEEAIYLGDISFELNAPGRYLSIKEGPDPEDQEIIRFGKQGDNYGLFIYGPDGQVKVQADRFGIEINVEDGLSIMGETVRWDKDQFKIGGPTAGLTWNAATGTLTVKGNIVMTGGSISWADMDAESREAVIGPQGPQGPQGPPGSDADVPDWVTEWNDGSTVVTSGYICTPKIFIGQGGQLATGIKVELDGIVSYKDSIREGFSLTNTGALGLYTQGSLAALFNYDHSGSGGEGEASDRVWLRTFSGHALKIESVNANMSIAASGGNKIWFGDSVFPNSLVVPVGYNKYAS